MIKFENTEVLGWEHAIRGMRNPMNSWDKSDSCYKRVTVREDELSNKKVASYIIGNNDLKLMKALASAGTDHRKYLRMITVYVDITAPLYWYKEFDTYKVGTVANSCSTMHKIHEKEFELDDFSHEHLTKGVIEDCMNPLIETLNYARRLFLEYDKLDKELFEEVIDNKKDLWWQMIQLLPSSYNQKRTVMLNYEVLANIYKSRKNHKLDEWRVGFVEWIKTLPYADELIIGEANG